MWVSIACTNTQDRYKHTKNSNLIPAGQKQKGKDQQLPPFFQRFLLVIINGVQMERQQIVTRAMAIHLTNTKPEITAGISYIYWVAVMLSSRVFLFFSVSEFWKSISSSHPSQTAYAKRASFGISRSFILTNVHLPSSRATQCKEIFFLIA